MGSQDEWEVEFSWRRIYCALNETLAEAVLKKILAGFLAELRRDDLLAELRCRDLYYVLAKTVRMVEDAEELWADYVRMVHPNAPNGFEEIGRMGNESKKQRQSDPPERRLWVKGFGRHPDDSSSDYGRI